MKRSLVLCMFATIACSGSENGSSKDTDGGPGNGGESGSGGDNGSGGSSGKGAGGSTDTGGKQGTGGGSAGSQGTGGAGTGGKGTAGAPAGDYSVLERNKHANRDGAFVEPTLTTAVAATLVKTADFNGTFTGNMWASPLYSATGPGPSGAFFAVTTGNDVFALDGATGAMLWKKNIGSSPQSSGAGCGSIHPVGIISTPVIDAAAGTIYVAGAIGTAQIDRHEVHALAIMDGTERPGYPVTVTGTSGGTTFTPPPQNQRSALSLVNGTLYVAYGGHVGDCGNYHGWVFGIDTKDPT
jgi:hypothetical protein